MNPSDVKVGMQVRYSPSLGGPSFAAIIADGPWQINASTWAVRLEQLGDDYKRHTKRDRSSAPCAVLNRITPDDGAPPATTRRKITTLTPAEMAVVEQYRRDTTLRAAREYIAANISAGTKNLTRGLCAHLELGSRRTMIRRLRELGSGYQQMLDDLRFDRTREWLLSTPPRTLPDIARDLGYANRTALSFAFKRWSGLTPTQWLTRQAQQNVEAAQ